MIFVRIMSLKQETLDAWAGPNLIHPMQLNYMIIAPCRVQSELADQVAQLPYPV